jgi:hypothetical protein
MALSSESPRGIRQEMEVLPYVQAWEGRMKAIAGEYAGRGVRVVAVSSNDAANYPLDSFQEMKKRTAAGLPRRDR